MKSPTAQMPNVSGKRKADTLHKTTDYQISRVNERYFTTTNRKNNFANRHRV
jgi:hypothetical protein